MEGYLNIQKALNQLVKKLNSWFTGTIEMLPNLFVALIVLFIIVKVSHPIARLVARAILRLTRRRHIARILATMTRLAIIATGIILALDVMNWDRMVASLLAGVGILGIAFGFASQDITANFMSGVLLHFYHPFRLGDRVKSGDNLGYIEELNLRATVMRGLQGEIITIPNKDVLGKPITNYYLTGARRIDLYIGIDYTPDLQEVEELAIRAVESLDLRIPDRPVDFFYEEIKNTTVIFRIRFWTDHEQPIYLKAKSEAIKAINQTFKDHGITRPSDVITLDFGITGGVSLRKELEGLSIPLSLPEHEHVEKKSNKEPEE
jgi:small conductance mechanosensitive channel